MITYQCEVRPEETNTCACYALLDGRCSWPIIVVKPWKVSPDTFGEESAFVQISSECIWCIRWAALTELQVFNTLTS